MTIQINGTTGISGVNGSAAAPALQGADADTGIFFGTDTASIATAGSQRLFVDAQGRVGIGESSPDALLCIKGDSNGTTAPTIRLKDGSDTREAWISNSSGDLILAVGDNDDAIDGRITIFESGVLDYSTDSTAAALRITNAGDVSMSQSLSVGDTTFPSAGSLSNRNVLHNGEMLICNVNNNQLVGVGNPAAVRVPDRFYTTAQGSGVQVTVSQSSETDSPSGHHTFLRMTTTTAEPSLDANDLLYVAQYIEGMNAQRFCLGTNQSKPQALSFWVRSSVTGTFPVNLYRTHAGKICVLSYTINAANTWEHKKVIFPADTLGTDIAGTFGEGLRVSWPLMAGSTYTGTSATTWTNYIATMWAGPTALSGPPTVANATWDLTGVQLEVGNECTPFEYRSWADYNRDTSRYYHKTFDSIPADGTNSSNAGVVQYGGDSGMGTTTSFIGTATVNFPVCMRAIPVITTYDLAIPRNTNKCYRHIFGVAGSNNESVSITDANRHGFNLRSDSGGSASGIIYHYVADCQF
jgi:hypothetical protein